MGSRALFRISPLRLRTFRRCRLQYRFRYVDRIPTRPRPAETVGAHVHAALKDFFTPETVPPRERTAERLVRLLLDRWNRNRAAFTDRAEEERWREEAVEQLRRFCAERDVTASPLLMERHLEADVAAGIRLFGRVDRVDAAPDGGLHLIDYKTGAMPESVDGAQLRLYAMLVERRLARPVERASFWYLGDGSTWTCRPGPSDHRETARGVVETAEAIRLERRYPAAPGPHCGTCPYREACPAWRGAAAE